MDVRSFWLWFESSSDELTRVADSAALVAELDRKVNQIHPDLSWEIDPGLSKPWQFVLSPNLNPVLLETSKAAIASAPRLPKWEFHPARQPKDWNYKFEIDDAGETVLVDASCWSFALLRYPDNCYELVLRGNTDNWSSSLKWKAAAIALESILGEEVLISHVDGFTLQEEVDPEFASRMRPIQDLRSAFSSLLN